jgi:hypothetical protein
LFSSLFKHKNINVYIGLGSKKTLIFNISLRGGCLNIVFMWN